MYSYNPSNVRHSGILATLRRIPDAIILDMATRRIDLFFSRSCICGWAMQATFNAPTDYDAWYLTHALSVRSRDEYFLRLVETYGGTPKQWYTLYRGIMDKTAIVEAAFMDRVLEAVDNSAATV
jgi:hypothetical protein